MRALVIDRYGDPSQVLRIGDVPKPELKRGQVLVKVAAAPIHPADIAFVNGWYGFSRPPPTVPGLEGCGTVVEAAAGPYGRWLIGRRVGCSPPNDGTGTWSEFTACGAMLCIPLPESLPTEIGSMLLVNPLTAVSFIDIARRGGHRAMIQTAAASAVARMIARYAALRRLPVVNIVRRKEQADALRAAGEAHVLSTADDSFVERLRELAHGLKATIAFDAVGGAMVAALATAMPDGSTVIQYGGLAGEPARIEIPDVIFHAKSLKGYWLPLHMRKVGMLGQLRMVAAVRRHSRTIFATKVLEKVPLERFADALRLQRDRASDGKVLLVP